MSVILARYREPKSATTISGPTGHDMLTRCLEYPQDHPTVAMPLNTTASPWRACRPRRTAETIHP
jgi:hypothetical protein